MERKCLLLVNALSGNSKRVAAGSLRDKLRSLYDVVDEAQILKGTKSFDIASACEGYDALCISGGDGTLNWAINAVGHLSVDLFYHPSGTMNDFARSIKSIKKQKSFRQININTVYLGGINEKLFSYVAATGTFTPIGYASESKRKKRLKKLAYWFSALGKFRSHKIKAKIDIDGKVYEDTYTLIMAVKSKCVFGFSFNKQYKHNSGTGHLLLIRTLTGVFKHLKLFFRLFRAFFIGFRKEKNSTNIKFLEFINININFESEQNFCVDGEKYTAKKQNNIKIYKEELDVTII